MPHTLNRYVGVFIAFFAGVCFAASDPTAHDDAVIKPSDDGLRNPTATPVRPAKSSAIDKGELLGQIVQLTSPEFGGREAGSPGQIAAAKYIASEFERFGLKPMGVEKDGQRSWFQTFSLQAMKGFGADNHLSLSVDGKKTAFEFRKQFAPFPAGKEKVSGKGAVAFAGYGINAPEYQYNDFEKLDLAGKWALVLRYEPQEFDEKSKFNGKEMTHYSGLATKVTQCGLRRAAGVLVVTGPSREKEKLADEQFPIIGDFEIPVFSITRATADAILAPSGKTVAKLQSAIDKDLSNQSFTIDGAEVDGTSHIEFSKLDTDNVIAAIEGSDPVLKKEWVVIGAHCDHLGLNPDSTLDGEAGKGKVHYGADDNASGSAGLLEVAQAMGALKPSERPKRSILFMAFSGEERGLLGSEFFVKHPTIPAGDIAAMLNMDMIGRSQSGEVQVAGLGTAKIFRELIAREDTDKRLKISYSSAGNGPSDHATFYAADIPVIFFFTGMHADYHRATDTWEKINAPAAEAVADLARRVLISIANLPVRPEVIKGGHQGYLGVSPDAERKDAKGYPVGSMPKDSPAAKAGIKTGDLIVAINGHQISNVIDLPMTLTDFGPGDEIRLTVERDGARREVKATLGKR
jgi:aminopeptidase YwaD